MNPVTISARGRHLDDWLSPILIKELRQGMRARAFVISFLLLQVFLFALVMGNVAAQDDRATLDVQNHFFWVIVGFALLILMPLRGLVAVSTEVKNRTMETIMLTRMTAWRVVFGKWSALFAQSLLLGSAVLPYVMLRYFIGGNDVVSDLVWILLTLWLSGLLIAGSIAVSAMTSPVVRVIVLVGIVVLMTTAIDNAHSAVACATKPLEVFGWLAAFGFFIPAILFELAASSIAPASENHALMRRVLGLLFFASACLLECGVPGPFQMMVSVPLIALVGICCFELSEKPRLLPRMTEGFARRKSWGRVAAVFLLPGWPAGLLYSLVVIPPAIAIGYSIMDMSMQSGPALLVTATLGSLLPPVLICHLLWSKNNQVLLMIILYNVVLLGVGSLLEGLALIINSNGPRFAVDKLLAFLPGLPILIVVDDSNSDALKNSAIWYYMGNSIVILFCVLILLIGSRSYYRQLFALLRNARMVVPPPAAPPAAERQTP